jgi:hypothetical protein
VEMWKERSWTGLLTWTEIRQDSEWKEKVREILHLEHNLSDQFSSLGTLSSVPLEWALWVPWRVQLCPL